VHQAYDKKKHKHTVVYDDDGNKEYINLITTGRWHASSVLLKQRVYSSTCF
jgi:hypothetical protein